jgi:hypothetical protein
MIFKIRITFLKLGPVLHGRSFFLRMRIWTIFLKLYGLYGYGRPCNSDWVILKIRVVFKIRITFLKLGHFKN